MFKVKNLLKYVLNNKTYFLKYFAQKFIKKKHCGLICNYKKGKNKTFVVLINVMSIYMFF